MLELRRLAGMGEAVSDSSLLARLPGIPTFKEMRPSFDNELRRSRRYERPLTALVVVPDIPHFSANGNGHARDGRRPRAVSGPARSHTYDGALAGANGRENGTGGEQKTADNGSVWAIYSVQLRFLLLGSLLCGTLRESDVVSYAAEHHEFVALLPECDLAASLQAVERLHRLYVRRTGTGLRAGLASFPSGGLTLDALVDHARHALFQEPIRPALIKRETNGVTHG